MQAFTQALMSFTRLGVRYRRAKHWWDGLIIMWFLWGFTLSMAAFLGALWHAAHTHDWNDDFMVQSLNGMYSLLSWGYAVRSGYDWRRTNLLRKRVLTLRMAAAWGDDLLAPLAGAKDQPAALSFAETPSGETRYGPFRSGIADDAVGLTVFGVFSPLLGVALLAGVVWLYQLFQANAHGASFTLFDVALLGYFACFGVCLLGATPGLWLWARRASRAVTLVADEVGLRPAGAAPTDTHAIVWGDVLAFTFVRGTTGSPWGRAPVYAVDTGAQVLLWSPGRHPTPAIAAAHEQLRRLIVTRTRRPLRTFSPAASALAQAHAAQEKLNQSGWPELRALAPLALTRKVAIPYATLVVLIPVPFIAAIYGLAIWLAVTGR